MPTRPTRTGFLNPVVSYSDARKLVTIAGWRVLLPAGEFTLDDLRQIADVVDRARIRLLEKRGDLRYLGGRG